MRIGIDIMGGDYAPNSTIKGASAACAKLGEDCRLVLIGKIDLMRE